MCGLTFLYRPSDLDTAVTRSWNAIHKLHHRGPDGQNVRTAGFCVLGHTRLAIIDIAGSPQPMSAANERWHIVFNGEIYNYRELRQELAPFWHFQSDGDTEVLLAGLAVKGTDFLIKLRGMWAAAFYDQLTGEAWLTRDRMGKKPLYYTHQGLSLAAASELPALQALTDGQWQEDLHSTADYFRYGYTLPGFTCYENIRELVPGHFLHIQPNGNIICQPYWQMQDSTYTGNRTQALEDFRGLFDHAVSRRMIADVEVGAFLSGGVDSSLVVSSIRKSFPQQALKTFTIGFHDQSHDERPFAKMMADFAKTTHIEEVLASPNDSLLTRLIKDHIGQPFADSSILPTTLVSQTAAKYVKVALSGDGGDELFCGYERYFARNLLRWYTRLPLALRSLAEKAILRLPESRQHHSRSLLKKARLFVYAAQRLKEETPYFAPRFYTEQELDELMPGLSRYGHQLPTLPDITHLDDLGRMMMADCAIYLPQDILVKVDRASMTASLETRAPFLDADVVDFAMSLPSEWHHGIRYGKKILHDALLDRLPEIIWRRPKQGFAIPVNRWFQQGLIGDISSLANQNALRCEFLDRMTQEHLAGRRDNGYRLWSIYTYLLWKKNG